jgi:hypothetical protein
MPTGTPLLAVADGKIVRAEQEPVTCGGKPGSGARVVVIEVRPNGTDVVHAFYMRELGREVFQIPRD